MKKEIIIIVLALVIILGGAYLLNRPPAGSTKYDAFAQCLASSGATFYGAFWCPHCKAEKALFGDSVKYLPYVECSTPDAQGQTAICIQKGIQEYPTWTFKDGTTQSGVLDLATLSTKTGCPLPVGDSTATSTDVGGETTVTTTSVTASTTSSL